MKMRIKQRVTWTPFRNAVSFTGIIISILCVPLVAPAGLTYAATEADAIVRVSIENISYTGDDAYRIEVLLTNASKSVCRVRLFEEEYYTQSEILGQWIVLKDTAVKGLPDNEGISIPPKGGNKIVTVVTVPLDAPNLYRNGFGDINLLFKYHVQFTVDSGSAMMDSTGDSSYWITPKTDKWVLREGM
jgi:hypothetical protein